MIKKNLCILGSTGSIGTSTLDVVKRHADKFNVVALSAHSNVNLLCEQTEEFRPSKVVIGTQELAEQLSVLLKSLNIRDVEICYGPDALLDIAGNDDSDTVMASIVGSSGLLPTLKAVEAGKRVLLANKEALVTSGQIFIDAVAKSGAQLLPIDSEHNAIFQCLPESEQSSPGLCKLKKRGVSKILLTGSGGPFRDHEISDLSSVTPEQACAHPNWDMGKKISVDSATMMNKGLEFIEAKWLFNVDVDDIQVVIHPQSTIHSMVQYKDGSVLAQMGNPDMRTPIAHALAFPERIESGVEPLDFFTSASFDFKPACFERYPNLRLAIEACKSGQGACTALNAANEVSVDAFLNEKIKFTQIAQINETSMNKFVSEKVSNVKDVTSLDKRAREFAETLIVKNYTFEAKDGRSI